MLRLVTSQTDVTNLEFIFCYNFRATNPKDLNKMKKKISLAKKQVKP